MIARGPVESRRANAADDSARRPRACPTRTFGGAALAVLFALVAGGCQARANQPPKPAERTVGWHQLGAWSGRGSLQTESFESGTGTLRVRWQTSTEPGGAATTGALRITAHSAISGRPLQEVVDHQGVGSGVGYVQQDPHVFYVVVDSSGVNWKFQVDEAVVYP